MSEVDQDDLLVFDPPTPPDLHKSNSQTPPPLPPRNNSQNDLQMAPPLPLKTDSSVKNHTFHGGMASHPAIHANSEAELPTKRGSMASVTSLFSNRFGFKKTTPLPDDNTDGKDRSIELRHSQSAPTSPQRPPSKSMPTNTKNTVEVEYLEQLNISQSEDYTVEKSYGFLYPAGDFFIHISSQ